MDNATQRLQYRHLNAQCWIAFIEDSRQAVWESWSEAELLKDLVAKGYKLENIIRMNNHLAIMR